MARKMRSIRPLRYSATLGSSEPVPKGKETPPWAHPNFSYRFTGTPELGVYIAAGLMF